MRWLAPSLLVAAALIAAACSNFGDPAPKSDSPRDSPQYSPPKPPSSQRSRAAIRRVQPGLTRDLQARGLEYGAPVYIRIFKQEEILEVWLKGSAGYQLFRVYPIARMSGHLGPKLRRGDLQAPEGFYTVTPKQMNPYSRFHLSLNLGYPNAYDRAHGRTGTALMVHGNRVSTGCFAMTDSKIEEIYALCDAALRNGQRAFQVHCFPFRMSDEKLQAHRNSRWFDFWQNLKTGYDWFEQRGRPPAVGVNGKRYTFGPSG